MSLPMLQTWLTVFVELPPVVMLLLKITLLLGAGWLAHFALLRRNPRWRVLLWRGMTVGVLVAPAIALLLPVLKIVLPQPPSAPVIRESAATQVEVPHYAAPLQVNFSPPSQYRTPVSAPIPLRV